LVNYAFIATIIAGAILGILAIYYLFIRKAKPSEPPIATTTQPTLPSYSSEDFEETKPILPEDKSLLPLYRKKWRKYEESLVNRYHKEKVIEWNGRKYPIIILQECCLEENQVEERFDLDSNGQIREYKLPDVVYRWNHDKLQGFMLNNPNVKRGSSLYNDPVPHIAKYEFTGNKIIFYFQKSMYYDYVVTNLATDVRNKLTNKTLREELDQFSDGRLNGINDTAYTNQLGGGCLVKSSDGKFIIHQRSDKVSNAKLTYSVSAGGTFSLKRDVKSGRISIFDAIKRHLRQEMAIDEECIRRIILLGLVRELERGGKIDTFFYVEVNLTFVQIEKLLKEEQPEHREELVHYIPVEPSKITNYIGGEETSIALRGCIYLLNSAVERGCI
jgi:predicted NUDIX family phosphoesterase